MALPVRIGAANSHNRRQGRQKEFEMTNAQEEAVAWVESHDDYDVLDMDEARAAFAALYDREADDEDLEDGLWSLCCAEADLLRRAEADLLRRG